MERLKEYRSIAIAIPRFLNAVVVDPIFETAKGAATTDGVAYIVTDVVILDRQAETFHDAVGVHVKLARQR